MTARIRRTPYGTSFDRRRRNPTLASTTALLRDETLFEFVVPMVPPTWNDADKVAEHVDRLRRSGSPTVVAVSTLGVCQPAVGGHADDYAHWCLTHFLLDG